MLKQFGQIYLGLTLFTVATKKSRFINRNNALFALSMSGMQFTYRNLVHLLGPAFAGFVSSIWIAIDQNESRRLLITLNMAVKAASFFLRSKIYAPGNRLITDQNQFLNKITRIIHNYGDLLLWHFYAIYIPFMSFVYPSLLPQDYIQVLLSLTGWRAVHKDQTKAVFDGYCNLIHQPAADFHAIPEGVSSKTHLQYLINHDLPTKKTKELEVIIPRLPANAHHGNTMCLVQHCETDSCLQAGFNLAKRSFSSTLAFYTALNGVFFARYLVLRMVKRLKKDKDASNLESKGILGTFAKYCTGTVRSSAMMTTYLLVFSLLICILRRIFNKEYKASYSVAGIIAGPAVLIETASKLNELNGFVMTKVLSSFSLIAKSYGLAMDVKYGEMALFMPAMALMAHLHKYHRHAINGVSEPIVDWMFKER
jgi:hypothetical protein